MMNMQKMLKDMQKMQSKLMKAQEELEQQWHIAEAGSGMVKVTVDGKGNLVEIKLDPKAVDPDDVEALEDLILAAFNGALTKKEQASQETMGALTQGVKIPGLF